MKKQFLLMALAMVVLMLEEFRVRGYFAMGAEILIAPLWTLAIVEWNKMEKGEAK